MSTKATKMTNQEQEMVHLTINNIPLAVPKGTKIMQAAQKLGIDIPHLCYHEDQRIKARCRLCSVEVVGKRRLLAACSTEVWEGMEVHTDTQIVRDTQVAILQLMLANHHKDCLSCPRNQNCDLQRLCSRFNIQHSSLPSVCKEEPRIVTNPAIVRDPSKCIRCGRCIRACKDVQGIAALTYAGRSSDIVVTTAYNKPMETTDCILCGQCSLVCPTGALVEKDDTEKVLDALQDPKKHVIVQVAPSVRVSLGDAFGMEPGAIVTGQMVTALHLLGFDKVFDTNFGADLTIMEEGTEFLDRLQHGGVLPMMTSCCPGWVYYVEKHYSDCLPHLSSTKSPMSIFGAVAKTYYPKVAGINVKDIQKDSLRHSLGVVLQDTHLFTGTVMDNIRYGKLDATEEEVIQAAKAAHVHRFVQTLPGGYQMEINEEATNISQGQKQLLTIARAILADPKILILDEATSSVDTRTEVRIQKAMDNLMKGRTSFVIAHRLSTIRDADLILVMKDGDIIEQGTHTQLLAQNGFYAELYNSQFESTDQTCA